MPRPEPRGCAGWTFQDLRPGEAYHGLAYDLSVHAAAGLGQAQDDPDAAAELVLHDFPVDRYSRLPPTAATMEEAAGESDDGRPGVLSLRSYQEVINPGAAKGKPLLVRLWSRVIGETPCVPCLRPVAWVQVLAITLAIVSFTLNILTLSGVSIGAQKSVNLVVNGTALKCVES